MKICRVFELIFHLGLALLPTGSFQNQGARRSARQARVTPCYGKQERVTPLCDAATVKAMECYKADYAKCLDPKTAFFLNRDMQPLSDQSVRPIWQLV